MAFLRQKQGLAGPNATGVACANIFLANLEFLCPGSNDSGVNSKINNIEKTLKILNFVCDIFKKIFVVHAKFHHEMTLEQDVVKKTESML